MASLHRFFTLFSIAIGSTYLLACKHVPNSIVQDIVSIDGANSPILYFSVGEGDGEMVTRRICTRIPSDTKKEDLEGARLRNFCSGESRSIDFSAFNKQWSDQYLAMTRKQRLTLIEFQIRNNILDELRRKNDAGTGVAVVASAVNLEHPVARNAALNWYESLERVMRKARLDSETSSAPSNSQPDAPQSGPEYYYRGIVSQNIASPRVFTVIVPLIRPTSSNTVEISLKPPTADDKCNVSLAAVYGSKGANSENEELQLQMHVTQPDAYIISDGASPVSKMRIQFFASSSEPFRCQITIKDAASAAMSQRTSDQRDQVMKALFGQRHHRLAHFMWHSARNSYAQATTTDLDRDNIRRLGWAPPRPILYTPDGRTDFGATARSGAGEDFLYMHRQMVRELEAELSANNMKMYESWKSIPQVDDPSFRLQVNNAESNSQTSAGFNLIREQEDLYSFEGMKKIPTMSKLGVDLEITIHNTLHTRWAESLAFARPWQDNPVTMDSQLTGNWSWDRPSYDHLTDSYSAHVNPIFWRIHGWVDDRINVWLKAHEYQIASRDCSNYVPRAKCFQWRPDVWDGPGHANELPAIDQISADGNDLNMTLSILSQNSFHAQLFDGDMSEVKK